jgi:2'-5' RNA ligase
MRLFIAFDVSESAHTHILELQKKLIGAKLTFTKNFHLTLKFLGEVTPAQADEVKKLLSKVKFTPFTAQLGGTGVFPENGTPRVVWIGIGPHDIICELQKNIDDSLQGMFSKEKIFQPHITLARVKEIIDKKFAEHIKNIKAVPLTFELNEFKLIESRLTSAGPVYKDVAVYPTKPL